MNLWLWLVSNGRQIMFKLWNSIYSGYNLKTLKNYLKKTKVKENNLFDKADSCITLINTEKEKSQHRQLCFCLDTPSGEIHFVSIGTTETLLSFSANMAICITLPTMPHIVIFALKADLTEPCWAPLMCPFKLNKPNYLTRKLCHLWCGKANAIKVSQMY